jgi:hypothetical protein
MKGFLFAFFIGAPGGGAARPDKAKYHVKKPMVFKLILPYRGGTAPRWQ